MLERMLVVVAGLVVYVVVAGWLVNWLDERAKDWRKHQEQARTRRLRHVKTLSLTRKPTRRRV